MERSVAAGTEPPPSSVEEHRLAVDVPDLRAVVLGVVQLVDVDPLHALDRVTESGTFV